MVSSFSAFAWPYLLFQVGGGWVADRFGARRTLLWCGLIWGAATILTGFAGSLTTLFLVRVLLGVGEGATFPTATRAMQNWVPTKQRGLAQGLTHSFARLGNAVTPPVVALIMVTLSWRASFIIIGIVSFIWVILWVRFFCDEPKNHPSITAEELHTAPVSPPQHQR